MPVVINADETFINDGPIDNLPLTKSRNGYDYSLVKRTDKVALYEMQNVLVPEDDSLCYEVFKIVIKKPYKLQQKHGKKAGMWYHYPLTEQFPGNESFGTSAWAFNTKTTALKKFDELEGKHEGSKV